jgi:autotransporter-associated beta strand protein
LAESNDTINAVVYAPGGGLTVSGFGTLTLANNNVYDGTTTVEGSGGPLNYQLAGLSISSDAAMGDFYGVSLVDGNIYATQSLTTNRIYNVDNGGFGAASGTTLNVAGGVVVSSGAGISAFGQGNVFFSLSTTADFYNLGIGFVSVGGSVSDTGPTNVQFSSAQCLGGGAEPIQMGDNSGLELMTGTAILSGGITTENVSSGSVVNLIADSGAVLTVSGSISDSAGNNAGGIEIGGAGTVVLSGLNHNGGNTTISGTLSIAADDNLTVGTPLIFGWRTVFLDSSAFFIPGTLITTQSFFTARPITLGSHGGQFSPAASTTLTLTGTITADGGMTVNGPGTLVLGGSAAGTLFPSLDITGGQLTFAPASKSALVTAGLSFSGTGKLDLEGDDMIVEGTSSAIAATNLTNISNDIKTGFSAGSGYWNGSVGIVSSQAVLNTKSLTALGYRQSAGGLFDGVNTTTNDVLVKYTYYGDANLDGVVNGADYQQIDMGYGMHLTGWSNGDFNYDGVVDGSDYSLIDNTFNQITATGASPLVMVSLDGISSAVPEPAMIALLGVGAGALLVRRRRD